MATDLINMGGGISGDNPNKTRLKIKDRICMYATAISFLLLQTCMSLLLLPCKRPLKYKPINVKHVKSLFISYIKKYSPSGPTKKNHSFS